ncbi:MAG: PorP/SprF family type IX secretion system membrane protein [Saprospiraceae bacterium]|nr:PorP/SprF family type IX secretion system membrane protein [Saprospiraceae bacterium]
MNMVKFKLLQIVLILCLTQGYVLNAQDPFYTHFLGNESRFNPAFTGFKGSTNVNLKYKSQWNQYGKAGFHTGSFYFEESMPCSYFDYGLNLDWDQEGEGFLTTYTAGLRGSGAIPFEIGQSHHNIKVGVGLQWSLKTIEYSKLVFSDELDAKYGFKDEFGNDLKSGFLPPNGGRSLWFFTPTIGFVHQVLFNKDSKRGFNMTYGFAMHNFYSLGNSSVTGGSESILGQETKIPSRYNFLLSSEFIMVNLKRSFVSLKPMVLYQKQQNLKYWEAGARLSLNRQAAIGFSYHFNGQAKSGWNTDWFTVSLELAKFINKDSQIAIGLAYSDNISGIRNYLGATYELTFAIHFASSPSCKLAGKGDEVPYSSDVKCEINSISPSKRKLYENIWYQAK